MTYGRKDRERKDRGGKYWCENTEGESTGQAN